MQRCDSRSHQSEARGRQQSNDEEAIAARDCEIERTDEKLYGWLPMASSMRKNMIILKLEIADWKSNIIPALSSLDLPFSLLSIEVLLLEKCRNGWVV
jgi:hypothetical protein